MNTEPKKQLTLSDLALIGSVLGWPLPLPHQKPEPKKTKCGLPSCNNLCSKDYCCADHCKEHKKFKCLDKY